MDPTVVSVTSPADILGVLPHRLGFHPTESLVLISLHGPRKRDRLVMRIDLPDPGHDAAVGREVTERLRRSGADAAVLVCYSDGPAPAGGLLRAPLLRTLRAQLRRAGIEVVESLLVREGRWWSYLCTNESCCPAEGTPLPASPTPAASLYAAEAVAQGAVVLADRATLQASIECPAEAAGAADDVLAGAAVELAGLLSDEGLPGLRARVGALVELLARRWSAGECTVTDRDHATVVLGLTSTSVRDHVMTQVLDHEPVLLSALFAELARRTPDTAAAPVATVLSWFAYAAGNGALAVVAAERALRVDPTYGMASLILAGVDAMRPPSAVMAVSALVRADLDDLDGLDDLDSFDGEAGVDGLGEAS